MLDLPTDQFAVTIMAVAEKKSVSFSKDYKFTWSSTI